MKERVGIVGAGIVGLAHAWSAAERGHDVTIFDRSPFACGASIRNFGMVWPIGQPESSFSVAMLSHQRWLKLGIQTGIWVNRCGSLHLAHRADEWEVLQEFHEFQKSTTLGPHLTLLDRASAIHQYSSINPEGFIGGLLCDLELCVNPAETIQSLSNWLKERHSVQFHFEKTVVEASTGKLRLATRERFEFDRIVICSGHDFETLYPLQFLELPVQKCKLQMMRTLAQPVSWKLGPHIASGLTLRHYNRFQCCKSLVQLVQRIASETPELDEFGIHVMASQDNLGRVILGDSHEYGKNIQPFDSRRIDELIMRELNKIIQLPTWSMDSHWHGVYARSNNSIATIQSPEAGVFICTGLGGAGMTLSFGVAEENWRKWSDQSS